LLDQVELQRELQRRQLAMIDGDLSQISSQREDLLSSAEQSESYCPLTGPYTLKRLDRLRRDLEVLAANRRAQLEHLTSIDARIRRVTQALHREERQEQGKAIEEVTTLRLLTGQASLAQDTEPKS
jgi:hypothetical protein